MGEKRGSQEDRGRNGFDSIKLGVAGLLICAALLILDHRTKNAIHKIDRINHAYTVCEQNRAYTPELQGQCVEDYLGSR